MGDLTYKTALVVIPPAEVWPPIQAIRIKHDAKVRRWMPHITLVYPFLPHAEFEAVSERLATACREVPAFEVELAEFRTFRHGRGNYTVWLRPDPQAPLVGLQTLVLDAVFGTRPSGPRRAFQPHLTVGQVRGKSETLRLVGELQAAWQPVRFTVSGISLIWRGEPPDDVFRVAMDVLLVSRQKPPR
jgi:2'-5' RNA ligase